MTNKQIEQDLRTSYRKITRLIDAGNYDADSQGTYDIQFREKIASYISKYPSTLSYSFDSLRNDIDILTSPDGLFRIYSWDTWTGGTMHYFEAIVQYKGTSKTQVKPYFRPIEDTDRSYVPFYSKIFALKTKSKTYYLAIANGIYSTTDVSQSIEGFAIDGNTLNDTVKLIKTKSGLTNSIFVEYDFFNLVDHPERPVEIIKYDSKKKIILIPVVLENGEVTKRFIYYQFNGKYFERVKLGKK